MATARQNSSRRREVRRQVARHGAWRRRRLRQHRLGWAVLYAAAFALIAALIAMIAMDRPRYQTGQVVIQPIVPRVAFTAENKDKTKENKRQARQSVPPVYTHNEALLKELRRGFDQLIALAGQATDQVETNAGQLQLNEYALNTLKQFVKEGEPTPEWQSLRKAFLQELFSMVVLTPDDYQQEVDRSIGFIEVHHPLPEGGGPAERARYQSSWLSLANPDQLHMRVQEEVAPFPRPLQRTITAMVMQAMIDQGASVGEPTYQFNETLTEQAREARAAEVKPVAQDYSPQDVLVSAGTELTQRDQQLIEAEQTAFAAPQSVTDRWLQWLSVLGLMGVLATGLWIYNFAFNNQVVRKPMRGLALTCLLLAMQAVAAIGTLARPEFLYFTATLPTLLAVMILTISYDQRYGLGIGALHTILVLLTLDMPIGLAMALLTGLAVGVGQLKEVRTRSKLMRVGLWTGLAMGGVAVIGAIAQRPLYLSGALERIISDGVWAVFAGVAAGLLAQGVLPGIERVFKVTTAMTLKELNDASHPLLQRLAQQAPGTYQHSLRIADLAESAAEAINADGLLCRVGAMYHDIGKINKPQYYIENQAGGLNRHSRLSPAMSLLIIVGHVKDGLEMAREYGVPPVLRHFIESHHGTTLVEYFFHAARKQQEAEAKQGPSEFEFRYPGPKPQTKEAGILLLCDSIEGAARSLDEPTPVRLEQVVHNMANKRLMDGQFDECNLTLKELAAIEAAITKMLCAIYHGRIKYPEGESRPHDISAQAPPLEHRQPAAS